MRITDPLPGGSPPPPSPPRPRLVFGADDILSARSRDLGGRRIVFQKVAPLELPPLPQPAPPAAITDPQKLALWKTMREGRKERKSLFLSATVYLQGENPEQARSFVQYWPNPKENPVSLWVNANFLWLTPFAHFETDRYQYSMLLAVSKTLLKPGGESAVRFGREFQAPEIPAFPDDGKAAFILVEGDPTEEDLAPVRALIDRYNSDRQRLRDAFDRRMAAERERKRREDLMEKKDILLKYWRLDAAGQAGTQPKPAVIR